MSSRTREAGHSSVSEEALDDPLPRIVQLPAREAQRVLLVRALEEADGACELLRQRDRKEATRTARHAGVQLDARSAAAFLGRRARSLAERLPGTLDLEPWLQGVRLPSALWLALPALLIGTVTSGLGPERRINVLANPVFALVSWNLVFLTIRLALLLRPRGRSGSAAVHLPRTHPLLERVLGWLQRRPTREAARSHALLARALPAYLQAWRRAAAAPLSARLERLLHLGAAGLLVGSVLGMYQRGLVRSYTATWESTFLEPDTVDGVLAVLLAPARLLGIQLESVAGLEGAAPGAAPWIHAWAISAAVWCVLPRLLLAWHCSRVATRTGVELPLDLHEPYFRRLLAPLRGSGGKVDLLPYSYGPPARRTDALRGLAHDVFGARAEVQLRPPLEYGDEAPTTDAAILLLFSLAQSPELEVHGEFVRLLAAGRATAGGEPGLLCAIDSAPYAERLAGLPESAQRMEERRRAWDRVLHDAEVVPLHLDLDRPADEELVQRALLALAGESGRGLAGARP